jgi:16S rRNA (cytosine967-C5)-methyltransferase
MLSATLPVTAALVRGAASTLDVVLGGVRASNALSTTIAERRLSPAEAERLAALVYGALRRERRVREVLREVGVAPERARASLLRVLGAALSEREPSVELGLASELAIDVAWERWRTADAALLEGAQGSARVALAGSLPDWLAELLLAEYGDAAVALSASLSEPAPRCLRANALVGDVATVRERLVREGAQIGPGRWARRALRLEGAFNPFTTRAFHEGAFELQDEGSQLVCELVAPPPRGLVVDACAGAGGKALAIAAALEGRGKLLALDVDDYKLGELRRRAKRAGAANVQALSMAEEGPLPDSVQAFVGRADRLLIDAPCSGTGVLRRNPESRANLTPGAIERLAGTQRAIIERMLPLLAPGGRLIFATCSLLRAEGEALLDDVEAAHPELEPINLAEIYDRAYVDRFVRSAPHRLRLFPHLHDTDGFFVTCLRRKR